MNINSIGSTRLYYEDLWNRHVILDNWKDEAISCAKQLLTNKIIYQELALEVNYNMPWFIPGIIHLMESNGSFKTHLHNGDPLKARTVHVPKGRPLRGNPPFTWLDSAADALRLQKFNTYKTWELHEILYRLELYNGLGYRNRGVLSPYLWSGTTYYKKGKYEADGKYNPELVSKQLGAAPMLRYVTDKTLGIAK